ncbi:hypothetical protein V1509DRAFT_613407 [Lipomyces kononenkoae]
MSREDPINRTHADLNIENNIKSPLTGSQNTRNFGFVNVTGSTKPDPVSRPFIRSYVMREANRLPSQKTGEDSSSNTREQGTQTQKFRFSSTGLQPVLSSTRRRIARPNSEGSVNSSKSVREAVSSVGTEDSVLSTVCGVEDEGSAAGALELIYELPNMSLQGPSHAFDTSQFAPNEQNPLSQPADSLIGTISRASNLQGAEMFNLFDPLPVLQSQRIQQLLDHYHRALFDSNLKLSVALANAYHQLDQSHLIYSCSLMRAARKTWYGLFIHDAAFSSVILCIAAGNLSLLEHVGDSVESLHWKNEAIKIINRRLDESPSKLTAATIAAVASLVSYELTSVRQKAMNDSLPNVQTHISGLEQIINVLGGLHNIRLPHLLRLIAWADVDSANALSTLPRFPLIGILQGDPMSESTIQVPKPYLKRPDELDECLMKVFADIQHLSRLLEMEYTSELDQLLSTDSVCLVERRLIYIIATTTDSHHSKVERTCCLAGLIFIKCFLCRVSPNYAIIRRLIEKLAASIDGQLPSSRGYKPYSGSTEFVVWSVFVGAVAADSNRRRWFIERLVTNDLMKQDWGEVKAALQQICFPEFIAEPVAKCVWEEAHKLLDGGGQFP